MGYFAQAKQLFIWQKKKVITIYVHSLRDVALTSRSSKPYEPKPISRQSMVNLNQAEPYPAQLLSKFLPTA